MFSPEMLKEAVPMLLASMDSNPIQDVERVLTHWFEDKKQRTPLLDGEDELVLMFVLSGQQLLMVPCTVDNSANPVVIRRFLADQGLNVSQFAAKLLFSEVVTLSLAAGSDPRPFYERVMEMLFKAAAHPACRLVDETPEPVALPAAIEQFIATPLISHGDLEKVNGPLKIEVVSETTDTIELPLGVVAGLPDKRDEEE